MNFGVGLANNSWQHWGWSCFEALKPAPLLLGFQAELKTMVSVAIREPQPLRDLAALSVTSLLPA
jgi:hypothetical protein